MSATLLLDTIQWDLVLDVLGNIAVAVEPYALAQDAASAIRLFEGELWYNTIKGVPYWVSILGHAPPISLMKSNFEAAALTVPLVVTAKCFITSIADREVKGQVQIATANGQSAVTNF